MIPVDPLFTLHASDCESGMRGFVVVHSVRRGTAIGGVRAAEDLDIAEVCQLRGNRWRLAWRL